MSDGGQLGKLLLMAGGVLVVLGLLALLGERFGLGLGRLPGDIHVEGQRGSFHFPIVTCIVLSLVVTLLLQLFRK